MSDWQTVRFDPNWEEKIDSEVLPLCDALNAAGLETIGSCWGHCRDWPYVLISGAIPDERLESLQRYLLAHRDSSVWPYVPCMRKDIVADGHYWDLEIHASNLFRDSSIAETRKANLIALTHVVTQIKAWAESEPSDG